MEDESCRMQIWSRQVTRIFPFTIFSPSGWNRPEQIRRHFSSPGAPLMPSTSQTSPSQVHTAARSGLSGKKSNPPRRIHECHGFASPSGIVKVSTAKAASSPSSALVYSGITANLAGRDFVATEIVESTWYDDALPANSTPAGDKESWNWISANPTPYSGSQAHQSSLASGYHQHYFSTLTNPLTLASGESLFAYVYVDPANPPREIMLQLNIEGTWANLRRAYWGENLMDFGGIDGTATLMNLGPIPASGQWVRLTIDADQLDLAGRNLYGISFILYDGKVTWDKVGKLQPAP